MMRYMKRRQYARQSAPAESSTAYEHHGRKGNNHVADIHRLPTPLSTNWEWQLDGLCRDMDSAQFFHPEGERGGPRRRRAEAAKRICAKCPVLETCREYALAAHEPYGVWGGMSEEERHALVTAQRVKRVS